MSDIRFGRLEDLSLREAWRHEALDFTPWLAQNIEHLSEAIGVELELTGTEVAVEKFAADILARDVIDDSIVLIECQLETTDHTHLGQIMTYLAGLEAQTVIWIAPAFREPHLSAVRWLNTNTSDGFSFFAVKARVVRIGDSPLAPIFEVVEKPDQWGRKLQARAETANDPASVSRLAYWTHLIEKHPELSHYGIRPGRQQSKWIAGPDESLVIGLYLSSDSSGIYVRGKSKALPEDWQPALEHERDRLERELGVPFEDPRMSEWRLVTRTPLVRARVEDWDELADWMAEKLGLYWRTMARIGGRP